MASFPEGGGKHGVFDLAGNAWEWTADRYVAFPGYAPRDWTYGSGAARVRVTGIAAFDPEQRVAVGGSFPMPLTLCRTGVRRGLSPGERPAAVGFRCVASTLRGADAARALNDDELAPENRARGAAPLPRADVRRTLALEGWRTVPTETPAGWTAPPAYAVIAEHARVAFAPVEVVPVRDPQTLDRDSLEIGPVRLGYLHSTQAFLRPELPAGTYVVAWRAKGLRRFGPNDARPQGAPIEETLALDVERDHAIVLDLDGRALAAIPATIGWSAERDGRTELADALVTGEEPATRMRVRFAAYVQSATTKRGPVLTFECEVRAPADTLAWR